VRLYIAAVPPQAPGSRGAKFFSPAYLSNSCAFLYVQDTEKNQTAERVAPSSKHTHTHRSSNIARRATTKGLTLNKSHWPPQRGSGWPASSPKSSAHCDSLMHCDCFLMHCDCSTLRHGILTPMRGLLCDRQRVLVGGGGQRSIDMWSRSGVFTTEVTGLPRVCGFPRSCKGVW
jgi:hypothetical protein